MLIIDCCVKPDPENLEKVWLHWLEAAKNCDDQGFRAEFVGGGVIVNVCIEPDPNWIDRDIVEMFSDG